MIWKKYKTAHAVAIVATANVKNVTVDVHVSAIKTK